MKKVLLLLSSVALLATANAQEEVVSTESASSSSSVFKQEAGDNTLEFQFNSPFANDATPFALNNGEIRYRKFQSKTFALRVGFSYAYNTSLDNSFNPFLSATKGRGLTVLTDEDGKQTESWADSKRNVALSLKPGFEMHFDGTEKLSPYVGVVATIGYTKTTVIDREGVDGDNMAVTSGANAKDFSKVLKQKTRNGSINFGLNAVAGFDYYFTKKLYIGGEMGFGFNANRAYATKTSGDFTDKDKAGVFAGEEAKTVKSGITEGGINPSVIGSFRLGFAF